MAVEIETYRTFSAEGHDIYHGDAIRVLSGRAIPDGSIDLIFADPPYNIGKRFSNFHDSWPDDAAYAKWCHEWLGLCIGKLTSTGALFVMASTQSMPFIDIFLREHITIKSRICWHYDSSGVQAKSYYGSTYEPILFCVKNPKEYYFDATAVSISARTGATRKLVDYRKPIPSLYSSSKIPGNVWYFPRVRYRMPEYEVHPSQKPERLLERVILGSCPPGGRVLDPFSGTFTTSAVAKRLGRLSIGIESQLEYVKIGLRRLGIQTELDGQALLPAQKSFARRQKPEPTDQISLLGGASDGY